MNTKQCYKCKEVKDASEFNRNRTKKDGLSTYCKKCSIAVNSINIQKRISGELEYSKTEVKKMS